MRANVPKGMGGGAQNMQAMIRQAQKMQEDMAALQEDLDGREYEISAGGGVVGVKINGKKEILSIDIQPEIVDPDDIETLSDILVDGNEYRKELETEFHKTIKTLCFLNFTFNFLSQKSSDDSFQPSLPSKEHFERSAPFCYGENKPQSSPCSRYRFKRYRICY